MSTNAEGRLEFSNLDDLYSLTEVEHSIRKRLSDPENPIVEDIRGIYEDRLEQVRREQQAFLERPGLQTGLVLLASRAIRAHDQLVSDEPLLGDVTEAKKAQLDKVLSVIFFFTRYELLESDEGQKLTELIQNCGLFAGEVIASRELHLEVRETSDSELTEREATDDPTTTTKIDETTKDNGPTIPENTSDHLDEPLDVTEVESVSVTQLAISHDGIVINGKDVVPFILPGTRGNRVIMREERDRVIRRALSIGNAQFKPGQLFSDFASDVQGNRRQHIYWLLGIHINGEPLFMTNHIPGRGRKMWLNPDISFEVVPDEKSEHIETHDTSAQVQLASPEDADDHEICGIQYSSFYVAADHFRRFNTWLGLGNLPTVSDDIVEKLEPYMPDWSDIQDDLGAVTQRRHEAIMQVYKLLEDETTFDEYLAIEDKPEGVDDFLNILVDLDKTIAMKLLLAQNRSQVTSKLIVRVGEVLLDVQSVVIDASGSLVLPPGFEPTQAGLERYLQAAFREQAEGETVSVQTPDMRVIAIAPKVEHADTTDMDSDSIQTILITGSDGRPRVVEAEVLNDEPSDDISIVAVPELPHEQRTHLSKGERDKVILRAIERDINDLIAQLLRVPNYDPSSALTRPQVAAMLTKFTSRMARNAEERGIGPAATTTNPSVRYTFADILLVAYSASKHNVYASHRSTVDAVISYKTDVIIQKYHDGTLRRG